MEGEQCHGSHQIVDLLKIASKTGLYIALYDFSGRGFTLLSALLQLIVKLVCIHLHLKDDWQQVDWMKGE